MPSSAASTQIPRLTTVQWVDHVSRLEGVPGEFRRHGRYLYLTADWSDGVLADGHVVDGLQLVRTSPDSPTRLDVGGLVLEGVEDDGSVGVRVVSRASARGGVVSP
jgi:hypothetical protein